MLACHHTKPVLPLKLLASPSRKADACGGSRGIDGAQSALNAIASGDLAQKGWVVAPGSLIMGHLPER